MITGSATSEIGFDNQCCVLLSTRFYGYIYINGNVVHVGIFCIVEN